MKYIAPEVELKILMTLDVITVSPNPDTPKPDDEMDDDEW